MANTANIATDPSEFTGILENEPVAIVGIGCRLPGAIDHVDALWDLLIARGNNVSEVPPDRWNLDRYYHPDSAAAGRLISRRGGFVNQLKEFDAAFWGISPREAARMDPQQRWLLETTWEAIEDAGQAPTRLRGQSVGVYVGASSHDFGTLQLNDLDGIDVHSNTGATSSILANRLSYLFDWHGPSLTVDTACSSALVAIVMAIEAIRSGRCETAVAGGVNSLLVPNAGVGFSKASMLSPTGECHAFDDRANGYVRSEGAAVMYLKPLALAIESNDSIYAVIRGGAINQDGNTSSMTVPSADGQAEMLRMAYADAQIDPREVVFVEAHGTGTQVGDPIEAKALGEVFGQGRPADRPLWIGSVKSNLGHLESASGIAGMIKAALVLQRGIIPANANFKIPNQNISFAEQKLHVVDRPTELPATQDRLPIVGVNSFGFGGTNAHLVLQAAPGPREAKRQPDGREVRGAAGDGNAADERHAGHERAKRPVLLPISARDSESLRATAKAYRRALAQLDRSKDDETELVDFCYSAAARREQHDERLVVIGDNAAELRSNLTAWLGNSEATIKRPSVANEGSSVSPENLGFVAAHRSATQLDPDGPTMVFTGQGSQWLGMGLDLRKSEPIFARAIDEIDQIFESFSGWSLIDAMEDEDPDRINQTIVAQPAIFAIQVGLVRLWQSWGVTPARVVGHSVGEVAAAWAAGIYELPVAVELVYHRSRLQGTTAGRGRMAAIGMSVEEATRWITDACDQVAITAINGPEMVTIGGEIEPMETLVSRLQDNDVFTRWLKLDYAFHTHQMNEIESDLRNALANLNARPATTPFYSTVTGGVLDTTPMDADYWWRNVRQPVRFVDAIEQAIGDGARVFLEIGPHPAMRSSLQSIVASSSPVNAEQTAVLHSITRDGDASKSMMMTLARMHVDRLAQTLSPADWQAIDQSTDRFIRQPVYRWNRKTFWSEAVGAATQTQAVEHPLLHERMPTAKPIWQTKLDPAVVTYLKDHRIWDGILFPASGYVEIGFAVASTMYPEQGYSVEDVELESAMFIGSETRTYLQVVLDESEQQIEIYASSDKLNWQRHGRCRLVAISRATRPTVGDRNSGHQDIQLIQNDPDAKHVGHDTLYTGLRAKGYGFGDDFSLIQQMWSTDQRSCAEIGVPPSLKDDFELPNGYQFHPTLLDACFQASLRPLDPSEPDRFYLPTSIERVRLWRKVDGSKLFAVARNWSSHENQTRCDVDVYGEDGLVTADIRGFCVTSTQPSGDRSIQSKNDSRSGSKEDLLVRVGWRPRRLPGTQAEGSCRFARSEELIESVSPTWQQTRQSHQVELYHREITPALEAFSVAAIQTAWIELGWSSRFGWSVGETFCLADLLATYVFADEHHQLIEMQLRCLEHAGWLKASIADVPHYEVLRKFQSINVAQRLDELLATYPQTAAEIELLRATACNMAPILAGELDPLNLLFPAGSDELMRRVYTHSSDLASYRDLIAATVEKLIKGLPPGRVLRILEVGGGTAAMTQAVIEAIENLTVQAVQRGEETWQVEYLFTDISPAFLLSAKSRLKSSVDMRFAVLDIERDLSEQEAIVEKFDLVIAANVLHATQDLRQSLQKLHDGLANDGLLVIHEIVGHDPTLENVFGLLPGWWRFEDLELRPKSPLLDQSQWIDLLKECGFDEPGVLSTSTDDNDSNLAVFLARKDATPTPTDSPESEERLDSTCVLFVDDFGQLDPLADQLRDQGRTVIVIQQSQQFEQIDEYTFGVSGGSIDELNSVFERVSSPVRQDWTFVFGWGLSGATSPKHSTACSTESLIDAQRSGVHRGLDLVQAIEQAGLTAKTRLFFLTRDVQSVTPDDRVSGIASATLSGFAGVIKNELPWTSLTTIDLPVNEETPIAALIDEINGSHQERDVAYRRGRRYVSRLQRVVPEQRAPRKIEVVDNERRYRLQSQNPGVLASLSWNETRQQECKPGQIEARVMAGGINFRDVMKALAMYPGNSPDRLWLGDDFAGIVERLGPEVDDFQIGDRVVGVAPWALRSHAVVDQRLVVRCPDNMTLAAAATIPTVFLTTRFALDHVARLRPGESILIHAAAGGVGQSAIQVARGLGLTIHATAGSPAKRDLLRELGVEHVYSSRTLEFAEQIMQSTGGRGVDAVLNSLAGEFIPKSLSVLAPFGRFLEIGKADVYGNRKLGLATLKNNLSYHVIDLSQWIVEQPDAVAKLLAELMDYFRTGRYQPLTHQVYPASEMVNAFRIMAKGEHTGKNVIAMPAYGERPGIDDRDQLPVSPCFEQSNREPFRIGPSTDDGQLFSSEGTFLVTGGAGGFGFETAKWLVRQGVRSLALVSRSGPDETTTREIERLRESGIDVFDARADVTGFDELARVIDQIQTSDRPLIGVVHAAMVIDDDFAANLDVDRFDRVLHPKLFGAWHLHELTRSMALEHFILYSSVSTLMGAARQSHYNAGNEFLNALARHRRAIGLPALAVNWSAIEGAGFVHRNQTTAAYLRSVGFPMLSLDDAFAALSELVQTSGDCIGVGAIDWSNTLQLGHFNIDGPYFEDLRREKHNGSGDGRLRNQLADASPDQRVRLMRRFLVEQVAGVFGIGASEIDPDVSLNRLGMDSLMAIELVNRIESELSSKVPMSRLLSGPTINHLTELFLTSMDFTDGVSIAGHDPSASSSTQSLSPEFESDLKWDSTIEVAKALSPSDVREYGHRKDTYLLTGATGFLGAHLLSDLLIHTNATVVCLVRAKDQVQAVERIRSNLDRYGLLDLDHFERIELVLGDLESPRLGLSQTMFDDLSERIDMIYHNGANVNLLQPYEALRSANVHGTREVIRLAGQNKIKPIHFVSTYTVHATTASRGRLIPEQEPLPQVADLLYGYSQTKWVGEALMDQASQRGVPVTIYRPGHITGDSRTGIGNENDLLHTVILTCLRIGAAPMSDSELDATPVDFVSRSIVHLSGLPECRGTTYHLTNPVPFRTKVLLDWLEQTSLSVDVVDTNHWREILLKQSSNSPEHRQNASMLIELLAPQGNPSEEQTKTFLPRLESTQTLALLESAAIRCPPADHQLLTKGAAQLARIGLIRQMDAHWQPARMSIPSKSKPAPSRTVTTT